MTDDADKLRVILLTVYERHTGVARVSPAWLATEAMKKLDRKKKAPHLIYLAAHLQLRQLARSVCRSKFEDGGLDTEGSDLFPNLQRRYPAAHSPDVEPEYVLLEHLTEEDVAFNLRRLRAEAASKLRHADALEAWWQDRPTKAAA